MTAQIVQPRRLRPGGRAVVVSPSGPIYDQRDAAERARTELEASLALKIDFAPEALGAHFYSSGTSAERAASLMSAFTDPTVNAIFFSIGGATAIDLVDQLDYQVIAANPKVLAGISDSSTLLNAVLARSGLMTFHGLEFLDFARHELPYTTEWAKRLWFNAWSGKYSPNTNWRDLEGDTTTYCGWRTIKPGRADGIAVGGNSDAFMQLVDTDYCPHLGGAILFLETYRLQKRHIQALLAELKLRKVFDQIGGFIIGYCLGSDARGAGNDRDIANIIEEVTVGYDFPVIQIGEIGHQVENLILPIGARLRIDADVPTIMLAEPAVM